MRVDNETRIVNIAFKYMRIVQSKFAKANPPKFRKSGKGGY